MPGRVLDAVPICYVHDIDRSRDFYCLFGFTEISGGGTGEAYWSYLRCGECTVLLAAVQPLLIQVELPLVIYLYVDDLVEAIRQVTEAGHQVEQVGYPDHAPGGEARTTDPDGNVVLFGQRAAVAPADRMEPTGEPARFPLMQQAAEAVNRRGGAPATCQIGGPKNTACTRAAKLKLADTWGDTVWACLEHAEEALFQARGAFIATEDADGLGQFLKLRRART